MDIRLPPWTAYVSKSLSAFSAVVSTQLRETSESMMRELTYEAFLTALFNDILKIMMHYREGQNILLTEALKDRK